MLNLLNVLLIFSDSEVTSETTKKSKDYFVTCMLIQWYIFIL